MQQTEVYIPDFILSMLALMAMRCLHGVGLTRQFWVNNADSLQTATGLSSGGLSLCFMATGDAFLLQQAPLLFACLGVGVQMRSFARARGSL